jgi:uncharacterized protein YneF (UPF0154 family)
MGKRPLALLTNPSINQQQCRELLQRFAALSFGGFLVLAWPLAFGLWPLVLALVFGLGLGYWIFEQA